MEKSAFPAEIPIPLLRQASSFDSKIACRSIFRFQDSVAIPERGFENPYAIALPFQGEEDILSVFVDVSIRQGSVHANL
jgi:hypothetical protein